MSSTLETKNADLNLIHPCSMEAVFQFEHSITHKPLNIAVLLQASDMHTDNAFLQRIWDKALDTNVPEPF